jgi:predicted nucleic acid-binding protein
LTVYVDSSVLVRVYAGQPKPLASWSAITKPLGSTLIEVEFPRAIDALQRAGELSEEQAVRSVAAGGQALRGFYLIELDAPVRFRAGGPLGAPLRSLDAIHLASALRWREQNPDKELMFATHDERLARAARMHGLAVIGWP